MVVVKTLHSRYCRRGFAVLVVLVGIAILMLLYFIDISAIFGPAVRNNSGSQSRPWLREELIIEQDELIVLPKSPKPTLDEDFAIAGTVSLNRQQRGGVDLSFNRNGQVSGRWLAEYSHEERYHRIEAKFSGNVDGEQTYRRADIVDRSKLYFITKGAYSESVYDSASDTYVSTAEGTVYVLGWIDPDYSGFGQITITTDRTWAVYYDWESQ